MARIPPARSRNHPSELKQWKRGEDGRHQEPWRWWWGDLHVGRLQARKQRKKKKDKGKKEPSLRAWVVAAEGYVTWMGIGERMLLPAGANVVPRITSGVAARAGERRRRGPSSETAHGTEDAS